MQNRRQALQTMAAGVGACVIPTFGLASTKFKRPYPAVMGVDQFGSKWVFSWTDQSGDRNINVLSTKAPIEHISQHMRQHCIERCVVDRNPNSHLADKLATLYPDQITLCEWRSRFVYCPTLAEYAERKPISLLTITRPNIVRADVHYWVNRQHKLIARHAVALEKIALAIQRA